jgi:hypothetical protein
MVSTDKSVLKTPYHIKFRYGGQNSAFPEYLWYAPQYWASTGIAQVLGRERIVPFFIIVAIFCSLIVLSSYLLTRNLFGVWPALLSSFLLMFSTRDYMVYLWGQWPQSLSFAFTPLVLYCVYRYYVLHREIQTDETRRMQLLYISMLGILLAAQFFFHPQGMIASIGATLMFGLFAAIKDRKLPFSPKDAWVVPAVLVVLAISLAPFNVGEFLVELTTPQGTPGEPRELQFDKLFKWYQGIKNDPGLPDFYFTYNQTHGSLKGGTWSWWTLPFLLIGIGVLILRKRPQELLMLGWLTSYYLLTRLVVIGMGTRDIRMFAYEAHVFYPIIAIGLLAIPSVLPSGLPRHTPKYGLITAFVILAVSINGVSAYEVLKSQQFSIGRINPYQYEAAEWVKDNLPYEVDIYDFGTLGFQNYAAKVKWLGVLAQRHFIVDNGQEDTVDYVFIDYTDGIFLKQAGQGGADNYLAAIQQFEQQFQNSTPLYNKNNIRVYKVDGLNA